MPRKATGRKRPAPFATRLSSDIKKQLEASAKKNSAGNMSREIERLLRVAFAHQEKGGSDDLRALIFLIREMAGGFTIDWRNDRWSFESFKAAIIERIF